MVDAELEGRGDDDDAGVVAQAPQERVVRDVRVRAEDGAADEVRDAPRAARGQPDPRALDLFPPVPVATAAPSAALELDVLEPGAELDRGADRAEGVREETLVVVAGRAGRDRAARAAVREPRRGDVSSRRVRGWK